MIKAVGALLVWVATTGIGFRVAKDYRDRPRQLRMLVQSMRVLRAEIEYSVMPLPQAMRRVAAKTPLPTGALWEAIADQLRPNEVSVSEAFATAIDGVRGKLSLTTADYDGLRLLADVLGTTDRAHLAQQFDASLQHYEGLVREARESQRRNERLWQYLGVLSGLILVILLY